MGVFLPVKTVCHCQLMVPFGDILCRIIPGMQIKVDLEIHLW